MCIRDSLMIDKSENQLALASCVAGVHDFRNVGAVHEVLDVYKRQEYQAEKTGTSWKGKLKIAVDALIPQVSSFEELLQRLQAAGYEIKPVSYTHLYPGAA